jgi:hypothetical protein
MTISALPRALRADLPILGFALVAAAWGCSSPPEKLPIITPGPPPAGVHSSAAPPQAVAGVPVSEIGRLPEAPPPRFAVSIFALPPAGGGEAQYSPEWTSAVVSRLERNKIGAAAQPQTSALAGNADEATARMAREAPGAPDMVPLFLAGTVQAGAVSQVRLICRDTSDGRVVARSEFEGGTESALGTAVDDSLREANRYWFDLSRGRFSSVRIRVLGLRSPDDVTALHQAIAHTPGAQVVRLFAAAPSAGAGATELELIAAGPPEALLERLKGLRWRGEGTGPHIEHRGDVTFEAIYD